MRTIHLKSAVAAVALLAMVGTASALVTFDPETGEGFVGKGDVQLAFGWNNKALQDNAKDVTFTLVTSDTYEAVCEWTTGPDHNIKSHDITQTQTIGVEGSPDADPRQKKGQQQFTGFILSGFEEDPLIVGELPVEGEECKFGEGIRDSAWTSVELDSSTGSLQACHDGNCVVIWSAPLPPPE